MKNRDSNKGFTLLEALISLVVVVVGMITLLSSISSCMIQQDSNRMESLAMNWAYSKLNEMEQNQAQTTGYQCIFCTYTGQSNASPAVAANVSLNHAFRTPKPWEVPNQWGENLTAYSAATGLPTAPNAVYIPDPTQTLSNGQVKSLFMGWYYIYFPTDANGNLSATATDAQTNTYYNNPKPAINLGLMGMGSASPVNNVDVFGGGTVSNSSYVLLPVTIRVIWQDIHTGDPGNAYLRTIELHGLLGNKRQSDP